MNIFCPIVHNNFVYHVLLSGIEMKSPPEENSNLEFAVLYAH